jgi:hypothetical protein
MNYKFADYEGAILAFLEDLRIENPGGYLKMLKGYVGYSTEFLEEMMADIFGGRYPGVLVEITGAAYGELKGLIQRQIVTITLYVGTQDFRDQEIARNLGISTILHDLRTRLMGKTVGLPGVLPLEIVREYKVGSTPQNVLYAAEYSLVNPRIKVS